MVAGRSAILMRMAWRIVAVAIALAAFGACSTSVHGKGTALSGSGSAPTSPTSPSGTAAAELHCPVGAITDQGAPFCYELPDGFTDHTAQRDYCRGWRYCTLVSHAVHDVIQVLAGHEPFDSDTYTDAKLEAEARTGLGQIVAAAQKAVTGVTPIRVAGVRAYEQTVRNRDGMTERAILAYRGHTVVFLQCDQSGESPAAQQGCARVLGSIQIVSLPA